VIVDTNVNISRWPFRRLPGDETPDLVARLRRRNVVQAWAGSFDGILHKDIAGVNARLAAECNTYGKGFLAPFGSINPKLPDWQEDVRRCAKDYRMPGIRLHPNYHGYELKDPVFAELLHVAAASGLMVQLVVSMEDIRTQHPLMRVPPVDLSALAQVVKSQPSTRLILLNWWPALASVATRGSERGRSAMADVGDRVVVESEKVGTPPRLGEVTQVSGAMITVRWDTGEQSTFVPSAGSLRVEPPAGS